MISRMKHGLYINITTRIIVASAMATGHLLLCMSFIRIQGTCYLFKQENDIGRCFRLETSNNSMNLWSETLAFAAANLWYSSNMDDKHHLCNFLKHPTRQPVRCWKYKNKTTLSNSEGINFLIKKLEKLTCKYLPSFTVN